MGKGPSARGWGFDERQQRKLRKRFTRYEKQDGAEIQAGGCKALGFAVGGICGDDCRPRAGIGDTGWGGRTGVPFVEADRAPLPPGTGEPRWAAGRGDTGSARQAAEAGVQGAAERWRLLGVREFLEQLRAHEPSFRR